MSRDRAAYMREYRAKRRAQTVVDPAAHLPPDDYRRDLTCYECGKPDIDRSEYLVAENARLTEEVHRLRRVLAQANRDLVLARVNRTK